MNRIGTNVDKTASGYIIEVARYKAKDAKVALAWQCLKLGEPYIEATTD